MSCFFAYYLIVSCIIYCEYNFYFTFYFFSHLADAFIQSELQIRKSH